jgi:hypothetical protein
MILCPPALSPEEQLVVPIVVSGYDISLLFCYASYLLTLLLDMAGNLNPIL